MASPFSVALFPRVILRGGQSGVGVLRLGSLRRYISVRSQFEASGSKSGKPTPEAAAAGDSLSEERKILHLLCGPCQPLMPVADGHLPVSLLLLCKSSSLELSPLPEQENLKLLQEKTNAVQLVRLRLQRPAASLSPSQNAGLRSVRKVAEAMGEEPSTTRYGNEVASDLPTPPNPQPNSDGPSAAACPLQTQHGDPEGRRRPGRKVWEQEVAAWVPASAQTFCVD
ncbi:hypothetical protein QTO34_005225, partial [Cnephaeus nilssonii]